MRFRRYPSMKGSEVEWIGDMPSHWRLERFKHLFEERNERGFPNEPLLAATQTRGVVRKEDYENRTVMALKDLENLKLVRVGDFVISLRSFEGGIEYAHVQGIISPAYTILRPRNDVVRGYYARLFKSPGFIENLNLYTTGIRDGQNIDYKAFRHSLVPVPPVDEQKAIAEFLDRRVEQLDSLVKKGHLFVERLQEYRQALITQAVTKGLDPNVPMKDSGIPWIGAIPQHWTVTRIRYGALLIQVGSTPPTDVEEYYEDGSIPWYGPSSFGDDIEISEPVKMIHESALRDGKARKFPPGTTLVVTIGTIGKTGYLTREGCTNQQITGIVPRPGVYPRFLAYYCRSLEPLIRSIAPNTTLPILNQEKVGSLPLLLPPREEQQIIAEYLDRKLTSITSLAGQLTSQIQFLQEYRQALITAAVTGKIDVRQEVQEHAG